MRQPTGDNAPCWCGEEPPIDLAHLRRYIAGDDVLGREIMALFHRNAFVLLARLAAAVQAERRREAAHSLKGSALAVGAWRVASLAAAAEAAAEDREALARYTGELKEALERTRSFSQQVF